MTARRQPPACFACFDTGRCQCFYCALDGSGRDTCEACRARGPGAGQGEVCDCAAGRAMAEARGREARERGGVKGFVRRAD